MCYRSAMRWRWKSQKSVAVMLGLVNDSVIGFSVGCPEGSDLLMFVKRVLNNQRR